jgi:hypothetical protein
VLFVLFGFFGTKVELQSSSCAGYYSPKREAGEVCYAPHRPPCCKLDTHGLALGFAGVHEMYEGRIEILRYSATPVGRTNLRP